MNTKPASITNATAEQARFLLNDPRRTAADSMLPGWRNARRDWKVEALTFLGSPNAATYHKRVTVYAISYLLYNRANQVTR